MKIAALAGGVGGAKLIHGLAKLLPPEELSVIVNTGDDFEYLGLNISPDLDTVCYTLADLANPVTGWGRKDESWTIYQEIAALDGPNWFHLGDKDLATHIFRTYKLNQGLTLSEITAEFCRCWGVNHPVFPMSDQSVRTVVHTAGGEALGFQEYFVHQACEPVVEHFEFVGIEDARPLPQAISAIKACDVVIISPSNPWVSIDPILKIPGYVEAIREKPVIAVSPLIGGKALKGPAAKMYEELGVKPSAAAVAKHYQDILTGFVIDNQDRQELEKIERWRIIALVTNILMKNNQDRFRLAEEVLRFCETILNRSR
ncbi:MAG TPA: 2-phospho-L-lactate transferase [Anaerolineaceae bacterium]|nr:MAG: LPPG:FO 2-phospho-L-lactate transferase [Anaerolineaceae bacterium 46_22]HAF48416.1 2-phospho-L-lactate transferase [Anaerolineaceae bacterium]